MIQPLPLMARVLVGWFVCGGDAGSSTREAEAEPRYQEALVAARQRDQAKTLDAISAALQHGACPTRVLTERAFANLHTEPRFRELMRMHAQQSSTTLVTSDEPGTSMVVSGVVRDSAGSPIGGALVHVFHADVKGEYTPANPMDEPHSRIFGYMRTDAEGRYDFRTVRPGGYVEAVELAGKFRLIPEHIHFQVTADGFEPARFQLAFDDDPRMDEHWRTQWAPSVGAPIVKPIPDAGGGQRCRRDIMLHRSKKSP